MERWPVMADHYIRCRGQYDHATGTDVPVWHCVSVWDVQPEGCRIRTEMHRVTYYRDVKQARRWAKKYKTDCPETMEPKREIRR